MSRSRFGPDLGPDQIFGTERYRLYNKIWFCKREQCFTITLCEHIFKQTYVLKPMSQMGMVEAAGFTSGVQGVPHRQSDSCVAVYYICVKPDGHMKMHTAIL